jgi:hypothetical protein
MMTFKFFPRINNFCGSYKRDNEGVQSEHSLKAKAWAASQSSK